MGSTTPIQGADTWVLPQVWEDALNAFEQATAPDGVYEYFYKIGGRTVRLCFANQEMVARLTPALAHLSIPPENTHGLTISLWHGKWGNWPPPMPVVQEETQGTPASVYAHSSQIQAYFNPVDQLFFAINLQHKKAMYWVSASSHLTLTEGGAPLLTLLHWWFTAWGQQVVHGAAVGNEDGGVLIVGKSGAGKSTSALACLNAGMSYVGDDYCLIAPESPPMLHSLYNSAKVHLFDVDRFPGLRSHQTKLAYTRMDRALYFLSKAFGHQVVSELPLRALLIASIQPTGSTCVSEVSPAVALRAVGPATAFQLIGDKQQCLKNLGTLVQQVPCYRFTIGPDLAQTPDVIADLLAGL